MGLRLLYIFGGGLGSLKAGCGGGMRFQAAWVGMCDRQPENTKWHGDGLSPNQRQWHAKQNHNHQQPLSTRNHVYKHFRLPLLIRQRQPENMERSKNLPPFVGIVGIIIAVILHANLNRLASFFAPPCVGVAQGVHAAAVFLLVKMLALADFYHAR